MAKGKRNNQSSPTTKSRGSMAAESVEDGGGKKKTVVLRSEDGKEFLLSEEEAMDCGETVDYMINYDSEDYIIPSDDGGGEIKCSLVRLFVKGFTLGKVVEFGKCCRSEDEGCVMERLLEGLFPGMDDAAIFDAILAADYLRNRRLLSTLCYHVLKKINGMRPYAVRKMFNIRSNTSRTVVKPDLDQKRVLTLEQNALKALHIVRCYTVTRYDPKRKDYICACFSGYNVAFFDFHKESGLARGPKLDKITGPISRFIVKSAVNVISLKVTKSDVSEGKTLSVFGTVVARDQVDYRCIHLFDRGWKDAQTITLQDGIGMLTLTDPSRGLVLLDEIIFEINLYLLWDGVDDEAGYDIVGGPGAEDFSRRDGEIKKGCVAKPFSRGVVSFERARLPPTDPQTMTVALNSWLSRVEITCAHVVHPVEATIAVNVSRGTCNLSKVAAWSVGNRQDQIVLFEADDGIQTLTGKVPLSRCVVAVPIGTKLVVNLVGDEFVFDEFVFATLGQSDKEFVCKMSSGELQVRVSWTCIPKRRKYEMEVIGDECLLH